MVSRGVVADALAHNACEAGLFLDFDGVLAPIVADPRDSRLPTSSLDPLRRLVSGLKNVTVVSGRPVSFLANHIALPGLILRGLYGLEEWRDGLVYTDSRADEWKPVVAQVGDMLRRRCSGLAGVMIEDKVLSVSVHWRRAADKPRVKALLDELMREVSSQSGLYWESGKKVEELRAPVAVDKGTVVIESVVAYGLTTLAYAGDDLGDLPGMVATQRLGGWAFVIRSGPDTPAAVEAAADLSFDGVDDFAEWLGDLSVLLQ